MNDLIILHKLLPMLVAPLFLLITLALIGLALGRCWTGICLLVLLWSLSLPIVADTLWRQLEQQAVRPLAASAPSASAIVVLSGMTRIVEGEAGYVRSWADGSDRFWAGLELFKTERAPKLIFTGGHSSWSLKAQTEGQWLRDQAMAVGLQQTDIVVTRSVTNTSEEAYAVSELLPGHSILLVTSAFHMPRAKAIFQAAGLKVYPFSVDIRSTERMMSILDFVPSVNALNRTTDAIREWMGRCLFALKNIG